MDPVFKPLEACYDICWTIDPAIWDFDQAEQPCLRVTGFEETDSPSTVSPLCLIRP